MSADADEGTRMTITPEIPYDRLLRIACALVAQAGGLLSLPREELERANDLVVWWSQNEDGSESLWIAPDAEEREG